MKGIISPIQQFIQDSCAVGITLLVCTLVSLIISNSDFSSPYIHFWERNTTLSFAYLQLPHSFLHLINDGLMALFFLLVGLEIKREIIEGELSSFKKSILPIIAAIGGMVVPALLYFFTNQVNGQPQGWGVPMATDIAFSLGILSLLGSRIPISLKIFLTALAIIDDLGAIITIAIFYTDHINWLYLLVGIGIFLVLLLLNKLKVDNPFFYLIPGITLWYCFFNSGVHATFAGVLLALTIPMKKVSHWEHALHKPVNFIVLPLFALANTAIIFPKELLATLHSSVSYGIVLGLIIGKPLGITLISYIAVRFKLGSLPEDVSWKHMIGMGMLAGIGFTMSIFISMLAFDGAAIQTTAKLAVLIASFISGVMGYLFLRKIKLS